MQLLHAMSLPNTDTKRASLYLLADLICPIQKLASSVNHNSMRSKYLLIQQLQERSTTLEICL